MTKGFDWEIMTAGWPVEYEKMRLLYSARKARERRAAGGGTTNIELREDGGNELREDGGIELRE